MNQKNTSLRLQKRGKPRSAQVEAALAWVKLTTKPPYGRSKSNQFRIADFFCGCGGLTLGAAEAARRAGRSIDIRSAIDSDDNAAAVYRANFADCGPPIDKLDISEIIDGEISAPLTATEKSYRERCGSIDTLLAGPPCQGHSDLNNSTRRNDPRNRLYLRAARAIQVLMPKFAFIENVPGVVHDQSGVVSETAAVLERLDYTVTSSVVDLQSLGLPQRRKRHILFAARREAVTLSELLPKVTEKIEVPVGPFISGLEDEPDFSDLLICRTSRMTDENTRRIDYLFRQNLYDLPDSVRPPCHRDKLHTYNSVYGRLRWGKPAQTITSGFGSPGQGRFIHPRQKRLITAHEAARIQGFPDFFDFSAAGGLTALRTLIGNAVPPPLIIALVGALLDRGLV
jgi:DNA (cytosine-5)-methyltransferase 1